MVKNVVTFQSKFNALDDDIILAAFPKSGTTWTKALIYSIVNRGRFPDIEASPLQNTSPMELLPTADFHFLDRNSYFMGVQSTTRPRIVPTHSPYAILPDSIKTNKACKIVYVWRNPMDQFISFRHFSKSLKLPSGDASQHFPLEKCFGQFFKGVGGFGPFLDHVLGYWKASQEAPTRILCLKYEDIKDDTTGSVRRLARFLGCPFTAHEEEQGVVDQIARFCSFENMKNLEANRANTLHSGVATATAYFRKGVVGDSENYFTPSMVDRIVKATRQKWAGSGLSFVPPLESKGPNHV